MKVFTVAAALATCSLSSMAAAQAWTPGSEIVGQSVQVETNGVINTVTFNGNGSAVISTPSGRAVPANWTANGGQLCMTVAGSSECFPYARAFQAGQTVTATSSCGATSRWLANGVNQPQSQVAGERG